MARFAILLRAVNLGPGTRVPMAQWRTALQELGCADVATYVNSGNAVATSPLAAEELAAAVRADIAARFAVDTDVIIRTGADLRRTVAANPFPEAQAEPTSVHVAFLARPADPVAAAALDPQRWAPERFAVIGDAIYIRYADGAGRSKLTLAAFGALGPATARNWRTVLALQRMTEG